MATKASLPVGIDLPSSKPRYRKNNKTRRETAVQGTNDNSIVSKCSTAECGYYDDVFLHYFVSKLSRRAPLIHRGYYIRAVAFNRIIKNFLKQHNGSRKQIISLGCGFDSTYFRLKANDKLEKTIFYEIDYPHLVKRKRLLIENSENLSNLIERIEGEPLSPHLEMQCSDYHLLGIDLTQLNTLEAALKMSGVNFEYPTLLFSECVMTYMTRRTSTELAKWAAETFDNAVYAMYEQINPDDAFGLFMQNHFHSIGSPLKCINSFPTLESQIERFEKAGWSWCEALDMNTFYFQCIPLEERQRIDKLEPFDEYEELNLKYSHYFILTAATDKQSKSLITEDAVLRYPSYSESIKDFLSLTPAATEEQFVRRFGHSTVQVNQRYAITSGGFGEIDGRHQRLTEFTVTDLHTLASHHILSLSAEVQYSRMHHGSAALNDGSIFLVGGRQSPYFMCDQMLRLRLHIDTSNSFENEQDQNIQQTDACKQGSNDNNSNNACEVNISDIKDNKDKYFCNYKTKDSTENNKSNADIHHTWKFDLGYLEVDIVTQAGDIPQQRWRHSLVTVTVNGQEKLFMYGGKTKDGSVLEDSYLFDPVSSNWEKLICHGDVPGARHSHHLTYSEGKVFLTGGLDHQHVPVADIYTLDVTTNKWDKIHIKGDLYPRYSHTCHVSGEMLTLVGGVSLQQSPPGVAVINLTTGDSRELCLPQQLKENLLMFHRHTSLQTEDGQVLIFGGGGNCFSFGTHLNKTPVKLNVKKYLESNTQ